MAGDRKVENATKQTCNNEKNKTNNQTKHETANIL
jgi:hypothetical protein